MSVLDVVEEVLREAGTPLHNRELVTRVIASGRWATFGKTPAATINAQLAVDIKKRGALSRFCRTGPGTFGLRGGTSAAASPAVALPGRRAPPHHLSFTDAAERVLNDYGSQKPMHYRDIASKALDLGLVKTAGKTPEATLYAQVITEIQRRRNRGEHPRFVMHGKGFVGLSKWMATGLAFQVEQQNAHVRKKLRERLGKMPPAEFEALVAALLTKLGFEEVTVTGRSGDGGIDVRGTMVTGDVIRTRMAVQVKRWKHNVQSPIVQQVRGSWGTHEQGLIITTSDFGKGARDEAARANATPVGLMDGGQLVKLLVENDIGVTRTSFHLIELADEPFEAVQDESDGP